LSGQQAQITLPEFGLIPAVVDLPIADPLIQQAMQALSQGTMYPFRLEIEFYWEPLNTAIKSVLDEGVDPASALQAAHDQIVAKIAKNR
jgi:maltose-binding protein MalE